MFDVRDLNRQAELKDLYEKLTGLTLRKHSNHWEGSCPNCEGNDRFYIDPTKTPQLWTCTHCQHGKMHTAVDLVALCEGLPTSGTGFKETVNRLAELLGVPSDSAQYSSQYTQGAQFTVPKPRLVSTMPDVPPDDWQYAVKSAVKFAHDILMSDAGKTAREYLLHRGFSEESLIKYRIGYNPTKYLLNVTDDQGRWIKASTGIYIPTFIKLNDDDDQETLLRVKVRVEDWKYKALVQSYEQGRLSYKPSKYISITGSKGTSLFCAEYTRDYPDRIIYVEGELDAMTINQCADDLCHAVSFGSHSGIGSAETWQAWYRVPENTVICFDNDPDPSTAETVRKDELRLQAEIIKAQSLDCAEYRANAPIVRNLPEQYHDWNDILQQPNGVQTIRNILTEFFGI